MLCKQLVRERLSPLSFSACVVCCWLLLLCERSVCNWQLEFGCLHLHLRTAARRCCATSDSRTFQGEREGGHGLRHRALWSRPALGRHTSGTGNGDGDNDAGIGISSSFEHHIRICDEDQRLKLDHAKATIRTTTTTFQRLHKRRVPQCLRRPQDANPAEVPRPAEIAGCTTQSAKRRQRARRCMDMLALALRRRDHSKGLGSHQLP